MKTTLHKARIIAPLLLSLPLVQASHAATLWTTTFTDSSAGANTGRNVVNTPSAPFSDTLTSTYALTRSGSDTPLFLTGTGNSVSNFNPRQNVDNASGAFWQADFTYIGGTATFDLSSVAFQIYRFNNTGNVQASDANSRTVNFSAYYTIDNGTTWTQLGTTRNINTTASNLSNVYLNLDFAASSPVSVDLTENDFRIRFRAENDGTNAGANIGINSFAVNAIPEPSSSLLLAAGSLLLITRRRA